MEQKLMAFWKYDQYPFILCGEVIKFDNNGGVHTVEYPGRAFIPILVMPLDAGQELKKVLQTLETEYREATNTLQSAFLKKIPTRLQKLIQP